MAVAAAGLDEQDGMAGIGRQAIGDDASGDPAPITM